MSVEGDRPAPGGFVAREPAPVGWPDSGTHSGSYPGGHNPTTATNPPYPPPTPGGGSPGGGGTGGSLPPTAPNPVNPAADPSVNPAAPLTRPTAPPPPPSTARPPVTAPPKAMTGPAVGPGLTVGAAAQRKGAGRRARLTLKRIDPWSTLKFSFVYSLAGLVVLLVAVVALYGIVDAMGVIGSIQTFLRDVEGSKNGSGVADWLSFGRVFSIALVVGLINVVLFTAFATLTAFIYNVCTDLVGGVEVTLAERG